MNRLSRLTCMAALLCTAGSAMAQTGTATDMYVFKRMDFSNAYGAASPFTGGNPFFIGNNPASGTLLRGNIYMGGHNNGTAGQGVVKVGNVFKPLSLSTDFNLLVGGLNLGGGRGVFGLDAYRRALPGGGFESRLLMSCDFPGDQRKAMIFDIEAAVPVEIARFTDPDGGLSLSPRQFGGAAWDFGFDGTGFEDPVGAGLKVPAPALVTFAMRGPQAYRLFANPTPPAALAMDPTESQLVYGVGAFAAGGYVGPRMLPDGAGNSQFRDIEIDSRDGTLIGQVNNSLVVTRRDATATDPNNTTIPKFGSYSISNPDPYTGSTITPIRIYGSGWTLPVPPATVGGSPANITGWHVGLTEGFQDSNVGDLIFWSDRPAAGTPLFTNAVRVNRYNDGTAVTVSYKNPDGSTATFTNGIGFYDFSWDAEAKVLAVFDFVNRSVYFMSNAAPVACTLPGNAGCVLLPANVCTLDYVGGTAGAAGSVCPAGTCCVTGTGAGGTIGTCTFVTQEACFANGNTSNAWTAGGTCTPNPCPVLGSCCDPATGLCTSVITSQCAAGSLFTPAGVCTGAPACPTSGSCCIASACTVTFQSQCTGTWTSAGVCSPSPCVSANVICCRGTTCTLVPAASCTAPAGVGVTQSAGAVCNVPGNNTGPCCVADFDKNGSRTIDDIFIFLNAWFSTGGNPYTKAGGNGLDPANIDDIFIFLNVWFAGGCG